jgi:UDP-N-acetylmuramate dehydrogenase
MFKDGETREAIRKIVSGRILFDEPMSHHTSMGVGGKADLLVFPASVEEFMRLAAHFTENNIPFIPVGNGTNLIVRDGGFRGAMVSLRELQRVEVHYGRRDAVFVSAEAGVLLSQIVDLSIRESLSGVEFCAGIPGSVGGGVKMNAGAYGKELKDIVQSVGLFSGNGGVREVPRVALSFEYRNLNIPEGTVIMQATFCLAKGRKEEIRKEVLRILEVRKGKHPLEYRNAGSIFKNLPEYPSGRIIDEMGIKGTRVGDAQVSEKHGNFIVNLGCATAGDVISLIEMVRRRVMEERGIVLDTEVKIVGEKRQDEGIPEVED